MKNTEKLSKLLLYIKSSIITFTKIWLALQKIYYQLFSVRVNLVIINDSYVEDYLVLVRDTDNV